VLENFFTQFSDINIVITLSLINVTFISEICCLKLEQIIVGESQLIGQVEDKYLATVCGTSMLCMRGSGVSLECPLLVSLPTEEETLAVLSKSDDCERWVLGLFVLWEEKVLGLLSHSRQHLQGVEHWSVEL
jgi:hypothetical protein